MQAYYTQVRTSGHVSADESTALQNAMVDYGALQPSPVHVPTPRPKQESVHTPSNASSHTPNTVSSTPRDSMRNSYTSPSAAQSQVSLPTPPLNVQKELPSNAPYPSEYENYNNPSGATFGNGEQDFFNFDFKMDDAELESLIAQSTQDFWASFPGEAGVNFPAESAANP